MTALTAIAPCGSPAHMRLFRLIRDGVVHAEMTYPEIGGRVYDLTDTEQLVAVTVLALRDLPDVTDAVARAIRQRPVAPAGEWLVVTERGEVRRFEHLCLDDLAPFDAARVVRLTSATPTGGSGSADAAPVGIGGVGPTASPPGRPAPGSSTFP